MKQFLFSGLLLAGIAYQCSGQSGTVNKTPAMLTKDTLHIISNQFVFTEGPAADKQGNIYFTDQPRDQIWKYDTKGQLSLFMEKTGRANGLYFDKNDNLLACADDHNELWSIDKHKKVSVLLKDYEGKPFNGPNDLWVDQDGGIYFTDPYYQRDYWTRKKADLEIQGVYYLPKNAKTAKLVDASLVKPNGIIGTPDGKYLYVADIGAGKTYKYVVGTDGELKDRRLFVEQGSDGMTLDNQGNLYITGKGVTVYNPAGSQLLHIPVPSSWVGNLCFGGAKRDLLFITASESVYTIQMQVKAAD